MVRNVLYTDWINFLQLHSWNWYETNHQKLLGNFWEIKFWFRPLLERIKRRGWLFYYMRVPGNFRVVLFNKHIQPLYLAMILHRFLFYLILQKLGRLKKMYKASSEHFIWCESIWVIFVNLCPLIPAVCTTVLLNGKPVMQFSETHWNKTF